MTSTIYFCRLWLEGIDKKKCVLILLVFVLVGCSSVTQEGEVTPTPNTSLPAVEKPATTQSAKVEMDMNKLILEEVNPMIVDYNGYPYRYQCDCDLYPMSWIDINAEAILAAQNIDETTKKIEIVGNNYGEASALEFKAIVVATVKYEDNKWKIVAVENIWL